VASARGEPSGHSKGSEGPGGGYNSQAWATAFVYAHVLAGQPLDFAAQPQPVPLAVWAESGGPGDDLRVECQDGVVVEVQVKRGLPGDGAVHADQPLDLAGRVALGLSIGQ
jgi:hypothetical protein